ncbi:hypothetical protein GUH21_22610, partial [Xanthomonas citri pv. citri]|nr:hypothetical protein [Xanthomonas citri pv. citri]
AVYQNAICQVLQISKRTPIYRGARISSLRITLALPLAFGGSGLPPQDADWIDLRDHGWEALSIMLRKVG